MLSCLKYVIFLLSCLLFISMPAQAKKTHPIKKIMLVVAMSEEAQPMIAALKLQEIPGVFKELPMRAYKGKYEHLDILLVTNGEDPIHHVQNIGTQAATLSTYLGLRYFHPDLIISIGTAGGVFQNGAKVKDIILSKKIDFYDRRIALPGYDQYGVGNYPSFESASINKIGFKKGVVCSGDSFDDNQTDYKLFISQHCSAIDMEAAGVAWVAMLTKTPMLAIKGIANYVKGDKVTSDFHKNLNVVMVEMTVKLKALLKQLSQDQ